MPVALYDTLSQTQKPLALAPGAETFSFYCCGPTVYGPAHIGNFRTFLLQDVLRRVLEVDGLPVRHVRNITDVDDKTIARSQEEGLSLGDFTAEWTARFHADCEALNLMPPHAEPRATAHISEQVAMIQRLLDSGNAYQGNDGSVYFKVASDPHYGKLANLDPEQLRTQEVNSAGEANDADEYDRESIRDFALWKARKPEDGDNFWQAPWGEGRPGWHIECSAMSTALIGPSIDLHGGGIDLCFPHHTNEIAQSENATGERPFARHWFHSAHLLVDGAKMSKSLGNLYRLDDLVAKGYHPMEIRYGLVAGHYRQQLNFTLHGLDAARSALGKLRKSIQKLMTNAGRESGEFREYLRPSPLVTTGVFEPAWLKLCDDLNVPAALGEMFSALKDLERDPDFSRVALSGQLEALGALLFALGLNPLAPGLELPAAPAADAPPEIAAKAEERWQAKQTKDFATADRLRAELAEAGWNVLDRKDGYDLAPA
ncbi:MAG: cysteine--tRNA ligase [Opitutales bacterium]